MWIKIINLDFHYFGYIVNKWRSSGRVTRNKWRSSVPVARNKQHLRPSRPSAVVMPVAAGGAALWSVTPCLKETYYPHHQGRMMVGAEESSKNSAILPGYDVTLQNTVKIKAVR
jgi:hypothetical protein